MGWSNEPRRNRHGAILSMHEAAAEAARFTVRLEPDTATPPVGAETGRRRGQLEMFERSGFGVREIKVAAEPLREANGSEDSRHKTMSQRTVGIVIDRLLGDESLRLRFEEDPVETVGELLAHGVELTPNEIDLFVQSDAQMWFWIDQRVGDRLH